MLLDRWDAKRHLETVPAVAKAIARAKPRAMRFEFSNEVMSQIAGLIKDYPNILIDNYQFALPKYETMYVEYNIDHFLKEMGVRTSAYAVEDMMKSIGVIPDKDINVGYLIDQNRVYCLVEGVNTNYERVEGVLSGPLVYTIGHDHTPPLGCEPLRFKVKDDVWLSWLMGSTMNNDKAKWTDERAADLMARHRVWCDKSRVESSAELWQLMAGSAGEIRNLLAMLLWLNQPSGVVMERVNGRRGWEGKRQIAFAAHNIVRPRPHQTLKSIAASFRERAGPRRHQVGEFWRNFEKTNCDHDWPIFPDEKGHWHCQKCPQWRVRVKEHLRGDASVGFVTKEYKV